MNTFSINNILCLKQLFGALAIFLGSCVFAMTAQAQVQCIPGRTANCPEVVPPEEEFTSQANELEMTELVEGTVACLDCIDWKLKGVCIWLSCSFFECHPEESILVEHFLPDFVISVYSNKTPFDLGIMPTPSNGAILSDKPAQYASHNNFYDSNLDFKNAEAVVNPAIAAFETLAAVQEFSCPSTQKIPLQPIYSSDWDPAWYSPIVEQFYKEAISGIPRMGEFPEIWGPIYPRTGWNSFQNDSIASVVGAQRVASIVSGGLSSHVFIPPGKKCGSECDVAPQADVGKRANSFQLVYPFVESDAKPLPRHGSWSRGHETPDERYSWVWWRQYECCRDRGKFIDRITF